MAGTQPVRHIVFYGTLASGERKHAELGLPRALTALGRRSLGGTLYDLGAFPGMVPGSGRVAVELYRIDDFSLLRWLDQYEGFEPKDPGGSLFVRRCVEVARFRNAGGPTIPAWVYFYNGPVDGAAVVVSGSWKGHRQQRGRRLTVTSRYRSSKRFAPAGRHW